ncbi:uncharacterized protein [Trachinotus anak]|uniref:uncharacterized protein isoform X2 n=1 Tax=Trachinotus anak TaxID=443729 RepID=UPI0039F1A898
MKTFTSITALLLCSFSWISVSVSQSQTVEVQSGKEVTLLCSKTDKVYTVAFWLRLVNRTEVSCISLMVKSGSVAYCDGYQNSVEMTSSNSSIFLKIKQVDLSDSGQYFCGFYTSGRLIFSAIHLNVEGGDQFHEEKDSEFQRKSDEKPELMSLILGGLTVLLVMIIIVLVVKIRKLQRGENEDSGPQRRENLDSDDLNYASVNFGRGGRRREVEPNVVYAATR